MISRVYPSDSKAVMINEYERLNDNNKGDQPPFLSSTMKTPISIELNIYNVIENNKLKYLDLYSQFE